jgi:hypothetical protein
VTLADLANLGELIGGVGVIVSLLYLAVQIRQSSRIATFNAHQAITDSASGLMADIAKDPELFRVWLLAMDSPAEASAEDRARVGFILHQVFSTFENAEHFGDASVRDRVRTVHDRFLRTPGVQEWWARQRDGYGEPFRSKIDERLNELARTGQIQSRSSPAA